MKRPCMKPRYRIRSNGWKFWIERRRWWRWTPLTDRIYETMADAECRLVYLNGNWMRVYGD